MAQAEFGDIHSKIRSYRSEILLVLHRENRLRMKKLRKEVGFPAGSKGLYPDDLEEWGMIEEVDRLEDENDERVFEITDRGREFVNDHLLSGEGEVPEHVENTLEHHSAQIETLQEQVESHDTKIGALTESLKETRTRLEDFITAVKNDLGIDEEDR